MIVLVARRLDDAGSRFEFKIYPAGGDTVTADDATSASELLKGFGVPAPEKLVAHACEWGVVEIPER
jgi:hypothetical protein